MKNELEQKIAQTVKDLFSIDVEIELTRPEEQFGDYSTNIALQLSNQADKSPKEIAEELAGKLRGDDSLAEVSTAGPGFINLKLTDTALAAGMSIGPQQSLAGQVIVAEYSDPNPFKVLHAGHLYTSIAGDAIANLLERAGGEVHRVNFGGDVGLHVAKTMWGIIKELGENPEKLSATDENERADWLSERYVAGNQAYEKEEIKPEIVELNKRVYKLHDDNDRESPFAQIYWTARDWSYRYFDGFYARLGVKFEKYYPESETASIGLSTVKEHIGDVYSESDGAIIFDGEKHDLHARVFINSEGLPTYEAKDVGLIIKKYEDYKFDRSIVITGNDIAEYMKVVLKSIEQFRPELSRATTHLTHGMVRLAGGAKMSSRLGNVLRAADVLDAAGEAAKAQTGQAEESTVIGAVRYAFVKQRLGGDIVYDPKESVSVEGNSGPYLQYAHARARSILGKAGERGQAGEDFDAGERSLARKISEYPEVVDKAANDLMPHHIAGYLYELAQTFNKFYEKSRVIDDPRQSQRLALVNKYADTLKNGLGLLGISAPGKM
jgi:arginyl-tRNA synthetase